MPTAMKQTFLFALYSNILTRSAFVFSSSRVSSYIAVIIYGKLSHVDDTED
jgi:hypothetical protein